MRDRAGNDLTFLKNGALYHVRDHGGPIMKKNGWHPEDIKAAIRKRGTTLTKLALDNGLSDSMCRAALIRPQPEADRVISKFLAVPLHELWPSRYDEDGSAIRHVRDEDRHVRDGNHRQIDTAA